MLSMSLYIIDKHRDKDLMTLQKARQALVRDTAEAQRRIQEEKELLKQAQEELLKLQQLGQRVDILLEENNEIRNNGTSEEYLSMYV